MANIGQAYVQIIPKAEGISGQITNVLSGEASSAGEKTGSLFGKVFSSKIGKGAMIAGGLLAAGVGVGAAALKKGIADTAAYGDHVDKMSQKLGLTSDEFQKWDYVMQRAGTSINSMGPAMKSLANAATSNSAAFQQLGISQDQVANMSQGELFSATIDKLSKMENQTQRTALASQLLGRGATELGPLLNEGSEAIQEQMEIAEKYGMVMPESAVQASAAFEDSVTTMQMTMTGLKNRMMAEFLPAVTQITDGLGKMFAGDMSGVDDVVAGIEGMASKIAEMAPELLQTGASLIGQLVSGLMSKAGDIGTGISTLVGDMLPKIIEKIPDFLAAAGQLAYSLATGLVQAAPQIFTAIKGIVTKMLSWFLGGGWKSIGSKMLKLVGTGIRAAISGVVSIVRGIVRTIVNVLGFAGLVGKVRNTFNNIKNAIRDKLNAARDKVREIIQKIKNMFPFNVGKIFSGKISLPKISVNKTSDGGASTSSSTSTTTFAKAMAQPYTFKKPTYFMAGEAGDETLFSRSALLHDMKQAVSGAGGNGGNIVINLSYNASSDASDMVRDIAREIRLYRMAGAI